MATFYKFLEEKNGKIVSKSGRQEWEIGKKYSVKGKIAACSNGFHASVNPRDALRYMPGSIVAVVEASGQSDNGTDKVCYRHMKIVRAYRWTKSDSVALAVFAAELVISIYEDKYPQDSRPRKAIEAAKAWIDNPSDSTKKAAYAAYADAAAYAAYAAYAYADAAAYAAYAAYAAAYADAAARRSGKADVDAVINQWMRDRIETLDPA